MSALTTSGPLARHGWSPLSALQGVHQRRATRNSLTLPAPFLSGCHRPRTCTTAGSRVAQSSRHSWRRASGTSSRPDMTSISSHTKRVLPINFPSSENPVESRSCSLTPNTPHPGPHSPPRWSSPLSDPYTRHHLSVAIPLLLPLAFLLSPGSASSLPLEASQEAIPLAASLASDPSQTASALADVGSDFQGGFTESFLLVLFSEIGDKTFFIAALLASRRPILEVFTGTFGALAIMTVISVLLGQFFHILDELVPVRFGDSVFPLDDAAAALLLVYFGLTTLRDAAAMGDGGENEEEQEAAEAVAQLKPFSSGLSSRNMPGDGLQGSDGTANADAISLPMLASVFALVFLAEWGDKSFFSTIALAAASSPAGVIAGSTAAHGLATLIAVLGGSFLASVVSEKVIAYTGATLFLVFAAGTIFQIIDKVVISA